MFEYSARYVSAYDGDTVRLDIDLGFNIWLHNASVRLLGINTPELRGKEKALGLAARDALRAKLTEAQVLRIVSRKRGKYGRYLADIYADGVHLNQWMIDQGHAVPYSC